MRVRLRIKGTLGGICHHLDNDDSGKTEVTRRKRCCNDMF